MAKDFQITWILKAVDNATATLANVEKHLNKMNKAYEKADRKAAGLARTRIVAAKAEEQEIKNARANINLKNHEIKSSALLSKQISAQTLLLKETTAARISSTKAIEESKAKTKETIDLGKVVTQQGLNTIKINEAKARSADKLAISNNAVIRSNNSLKKSEASLAKFQYRQRTENINAAHSMASTAMTRVAAPAAIGTGFGLKNAMQREQLNMRLGLLFGQAEGKQIATEMKKYAVDSALDYKGAVKLIADMQVGKENLGITTTREMIDFTKKIGDVVVTYIGDQDDINEVINQIGQVFMAGKASNRQDLRVMQKHGLPIFNALKAVTGLSFDKMQDKYGAETPAKLVAAALEYMRAEEKTNAALKVRKESLTQSWQTLKEQTINVSASFGEMMNQEFGIAKGMMSIADALGSADNQMLGIDEKQNHVLKSSIKYGATMALAVPTLMIVMSYADKLAIGMKSTSESAKLFKTRLAMAAGIMSVMSLATADWSAVMKDVENEGFKGWIKHLDVVANGFIGILATVTLIRNASLVAAMAWAPLLVAMAAGGYVGAKIGEAFDPDKFLNARELGKVGSGSYGDNYVPNLVDISKRDANIAKNGGAQPALVESVATYITNIVKWDGKNAPTVDSKASKKDPYRAPLVYNLGD